MASSPNRVHYEFFMDVVPDEEETRKQGRPISKEVESVRIRWVGDNKRELIVPAHDRCRRLPGQAGHESYAEYLPEMYEAFKKGITYHGTGTRIDEAPFLSVAQKADMKAINIHTIEELADPTHEAIKRLGMGGRELVNKAKAYLDNASGSANVIALAEQNAKLISEMNALKAQMERLAAGQPAQPVAPAQDEDPRPPSMFDGWTVEALKEFIRNQTGSGPRGNPSMDTLIRMAVEANSRVAA